MQTEKSPIYKLQSYLKGVGFTNFGLDTSPFTKRNSSVMLLVLVHNDDLIITRNNAKCIQCCITNLNATFSLNNLGRSNYFLDFRDKVL